MKHCAIITVTVPTSVYVHIQGESQCTYISVIRLSFWIQDLRRREEIKFIVISCKLGPIVHFAFIFSSKEDVSSIRRVLPLYEQLHLRLATS